MARLLRDTDIPPMTATGIETLEEQTADLPRARRNLLVGLWAAERLGLSGPDAAAYARSVMAADHARPGDEDVLAKLAGDPGGGGPCARSGDAGRQVGRRAAQRLGPDAAAPPLRACLSEL
jgi:hypothetical protein